MQNNTFVTECNVIRLYYENAEANILNDLFFETADVSESGNKAKEIADKICAKINEIIESIKEFFQQLKRKHESAKIAAMLKSECARSNRLIKVTVKDKEISKTIAQIYKINQKSFIEVRKQYDLFMGHKIDYETYCKNVNSVQDKHFDACEKILNAADNTKIINTSIPGRVYKLSELTKRVSEVESAYTKVLNKMEDDVVKEEEKLSVQAKRDAKDNMISSATSKISSVLSKLNKKAVMTIISVTGIAGAAAFCFRAGKKKIEDRISVSLEESVEEDYFSDILEDDSSEYQESTETIDDDLFADILNM